MLQGDTVRLKCHFKTFDGQLVDPIESQSRLCGNFFGSLKIDVSHRLANHFFEFHP